MTTETKPVHAIIADHIVWLRQHRLFFEQNLQDQVVAECVSLEKAIGQEIQAITIIPENYHEVYKGFHLRKKQDFGTFGYLIPKLGLTKEGIVVTYPSGFRKEVNSTPGSERKTFWMDVGGCNAMPGAIWFSNPEQAKVAIDCLIEVMGENNHKDFYRLFDDRTKDFSIT